MTRAQIRESVVEDWLAEANSDFYTDTVLNDAINYAYRQIVRALGGIDARWDLDTTITAPYEYSLPRDLIKLRQATYNPTTPTSSDTVELTITDQETLWQQAGPSWKYGSSGVPAYLVLMGPYAYALYPRAAAVVTNGISLYGRTLTANLSGDSSEALTPTQFDDDIAAGAYLYALRRRTNRDGGKMPQNFLEAQQLWAAGLERAKRFLPSLNPTIRTAGSKARRETNDTYPFVWP